MKEPSGGGGPGSAITAAGVVVLLPLPPPPDLRQPVTFSSPPPPRQEHVWSRGKVKCTPVCCRKGCCCCCCPGRVGALLEPVGGLAMASSCEAAVLLTQPGNCKPSGGKWLGGGLELACRRLRFLPRRSFPLPGPRRGARPPARSPAPPPLLITVSNHGDTSLNALSLSHAGLAALLPSREAGEKEQPNSHTLFVGGTQAASPPPPASARLLSVLLASLPALCDLGCVCVFPQAPFSQTLDPGGAIRPPWPQQIPHGTWPR